MIWKGSHVSTNIMVTVDSIMASLLSCSLERLLLSLLEKRNFIRNQITAYEMQMIDNAIAKKTSKK